MDTNVFLNRMNKVKDRMAKENIDVFMVSPSSNLFYLCGYGLKGDERLLLLVLPRNKDPFIIANLLYKEQVKSLPVNSFIYWKDGEDPYSLLKAEIEKRNIAVKKAALESQIPLLFSLPLSEIFPDTHYVLGSPLTDPLRQYKDQSELDLIRRACRVSDSALAALIDRGAYWIGKTESDFYEALSAEFKHAGLGSFDATVAVGANAALPHYGVGNTVIEKGKCFLVDFWASLEGYYTDCTRTFCFGTCEKEFEHIYEIVLEAHLAAEAKARIGNTLGDVDLAARQVIEKSGYGECFTHRTGHGLGIDVHEGASANKGVNVPLESGMVFSIEPGIYLPGRFGVRIENLVAIAAKGPEVLHAYPREFTAIE
ncbi:MAG: Xaa-Pro peptidase family protein [Treponema sp.]|nr:Xaa-Pro peptidase family protein [Treponema sp.]